jgi:hypothetical protein
MCYEVQGLAVEESYKHTLGIENTLAVRTKYILLLQAVNMFL